MQYLIQHFIDDTLKNFPLRIAVKQGSRTYSYGEIDELSRKFQNHFLTHTPPGKIVGILSRVRTEAIVAMIGALKSAVVYVPLNTLAPASWLGNVIQSARIEVLMVDPAFLSVAMELKEFGIKDIICLDDCAAPHGDQGYLPFAKIRSLEAVSSDQAGPRMLADDLAWVLYTSGSTGTPKGIMITHRNAFTFIDWMKQEFNVNESDRVFNRAPLQFDLSVFDIFSTFQAGARLILPGPDFSNQAHDVVTLMQEEEVTIVYTVPSTFISWLSKGGLERGLPSLRLVLYAGEPFPVAYLRKFMQCIPGVRVSNIYGPTETNIVTYFHIDEEVPADWESVPIGRPVHDTEIYIVDEDLKLLPDGEIGEVLVRGGTVFAGYFNDSERTREKLVQSPFHTYQTLCCRTGDLGRLLPDGNIVYHGRADNMIKTRGYRVEIGEVESALSSIAGIDELAVIAKPHEKYGNSLHAFISCRADGPSVEEIMISLTAKIPAYMVPYEIIRIDALPKTSTGKVDRVGLRQRLLLEDGITHK